MKLSMTAICPPKFTQTNVRCSTRRLLVLLAALSLMPWAEAIADTDRDTNWEFTLQVIGSGSESSSASNGAGLDVDSDVGYGAGFAYNLNPRFAIGFDFLYLKPDYTAVFNTDQSGTLALSHEMTVFNGQLNGIWNFMDGPFTPFVLAGIGWTHVDSNVADGPPVTGCWWDPWWGYICESFYDTYEETRFSYGVGAGLRYEFRNKMFVKGSFNHLELDGGGNGADPSLEMWRLELGWLLR